MSSELLEKIIFTYGPMAGILLYLLYRDHTDRAVYRKERADDRKRIEELERQQGSVLIPLLHECKQALTENSSILVDLSKLLKHIAKDAPTATHKALDSIKGAVTRRKESDFMTPLPRPAVHGADEESNY